jgi:hypothetical protein
MSISISSPGSYSAQLKAALISATETDPTTQTGTSYTYVLTDANGYVRHDNTSDITATVPPNSSVAFPLLTQITAEQKGAGQLTFAGGVGVTINTPSTLKLNSQWAIATLIKVGTNEWTLAGNLAAS